MRLAVFFPSSLFCSWGMSYGLVDALRNLGHEVVAHPIEPGESCDPVNVPGCDGVILSGPEHLKPIGRAVCPSVAWMHETVEREDYGKLDVNQIKRCADVVFCPAIQDEKYGFKWLPLGVNTEIFKPDPSQPKTIDAGFIGLRYPKRQQFLKELQPHLNGLKLHIGNVQVTENGKWNPRLTVGHYANMIRSMKVFVNLPSLSQMAVSKVYEVLACGTTLLTPRINRSDNYEEMPVWFYESTPQGLMHELEQVNDDESLLANLSGGMADHLHRNHRMELRCEKLVNALAECGAKAA